jgi:hypothetical protein
VEKGALGMTASDGEVEVKIDDEIDDCDDIDDYNGAQGGTTAAVTMVAEVKAGHYMTALALGAVQLWLGLWLRMRMQILTSSLYGLLCCV